MLLFSLKTSPVPSPSFTHFNTTIVKENKAFGGRRRKNKDVRLKSHFEALLLGGNISSQPEGQRGEGERVRSWLPWLQPALRTPTNIHVNCSLREINTSDKLPMPLSGAVMKVCKRWCVCVCVVQVAGAYIDNSKAARWRSEARVHAHSRRASSVAQTSPSYM